MSEPGSVADPALESFLAAELDGEVTAVDVVHDGLNLTLAVSTAKEGRAYAVRRPNKLRDTELFNDVEREYGLLERLDDAPVPTPVPVSYCDDESVLDGPFFVTTFLEGEAIPLGSDPPERFRSPVARGGVADLLIDTLAEIHTLPVEPFEDVCERQSPREQVERAFSRLEVASAVTGREFETLRSVGEWLRRNVPSGPETALVHGDFRPGNVLFSGTDRPAVAGVLDWETALLGDPLAELGYLLVRWRDDGDPRPSVDDLETRYPDHDDAIRRLRATNADGLAPFTSKPGSPTRREMIARYEERTDLRFTDGRFYLAHAAFSLATVWADLHRHRIEAGAESGWEPHVDYAAELARSVVAGEFRP